jgi:hypothetical protein
MRKYKYHELFDVDIAGAVDNPFSKNLVGYRYPELAFIFDIDINYIKNLSSNRTESFEKIAESQKWILDYKDAPDSFRVNSLLFRSDEFVKNHDGKHILFSGCSNTYGFSLYNHEIWPWILYNKIKEKEKLSGYYNLAIPGTGVFEIVSNIFKYINLYQKPDVIFINLPHAARFYSLLSQSKEQYMTFDKEFKIDQVLNNNVFGTSTNKGIYHNSIYNYAKDSNNQAEISHSVVVEKYINVYQYLMMLEIFCKVNNIQLYIYSHNTFSNFFYSQIDLSCFKIIDKNPRDGKGFFDLVQEYISKNKNDKFAISGRDKTHSGTGYHYAWASLAYDWYASNNYVN